MKLFTSSLVLLFAGFLVFSGTSQIAQAAPGSVKILKFEADWCAPCQQMKPIFNKVAADTSGVSFQTVNVDSQSSVADRYNVKSLPTLIAFQDGKEVSRVIGFQNERKLKSFVNKAKR